MGKMQGCGSGSGRLGWIRILKYGQVSFRGSGFFLTVGSESDFFLVGGIRIRVFFIEGGSGQYPAGSSTLYEAEDKNIGYTVVHTLHRHFRNNYEKDK